MNPWQKLEEVRIHEAFLYFSSAFQAPTFQKWLIHASKTLQTSV